MSMRAKNLVLAVSVVFLMAPQANAGKADDLIDSVIAKIDTVQSEIDAIEMTLDSVKTTAENAQADASEIVMRVRNGVATLKDKLRDLIDESVDDIQAVVDRELEGRDAFINDGTGARFKDDLVTLLEEVGALFDTLAGIVPGGPQASFDDEIEFLRDAQVPVRVLWPLYRMTSALEADFPNGLIEQLREANGSLQVLAPIFRGDGEQPRVGGNRPGSASSRAQTFGRPSLFSVPGKPSSWIDYAYGNVPSIVRNNPDLVADAVARIRRKSLALKVFAGYLQEKSAMTGIIKKKPVQLHGYVGLLVETDLAGAWGLRFRSMADVLDHVADKAEISLEQAITMGALRELRNNQQEILKLLR